MPNARAAFLADVLAAAVGREPRVSETASVTRVEVDLPSAPSPRTRTAILAALANADRFGHDRAGGRESVWAEVEREKAP
ncbi:hypothetical protein [Streptomyces sp. NPDC014894]|uniref:hypothetical protein n=1 Tax=unclassified Streptomyces TaxID=2593676 RepID=UPI0036FDB2AC